MKANALCRAGVSGLIVAATTAALSGCGAIQVTDGTGQTRSLGQLINDIKTPSQEGQTAQGAAAASVRPSVEADISGVPGTSNAEWPLSQGCRILPTAVLKTDVDTVYARMMKRWNFLTNEQTQLLMKQRGPMFLVETNYRHRATPGATYQMAQSVSSIPGSSRDLWLDMTLAKDGPNATELEVKYCLTDPKQYRSASAHLATQKLINDSVATARR
jgi:hypothetical protein